MTDFSAPHRLTGTNANRTTLHVTLLAEFGKAFATLRRAIRRSLSALADQRSARLRARRLETLDDRMLRDIGITRADLDYALSHPGDPDKTLRKARSANRAYEAERPTLSAW